MTRSARTSTTLVVAFASLFACAGQAAAVTVTFDAGSGQPPTYSEVGITVAPVVGTENHVHLGDNDGNTSPDLMLHPGCCSTPYRFEFSGGVFSLAKLDFAHFGGTHTFTASSGAVVAPAASGVIVFAPTGWSGITSFDWHDDGTLFSEQGVIDNLEFCPGDCNDANGCTDDSCDPDDPSADGSGCVHAANSAGCSDGAFCNGADTCSGGNCALHAGDPCSAGLECADTCNEAADTCFATAGTACTDDGNVCTDDRCNGAGACVHPNNSGPCDDGLFCTGTDSCSAGSCVLHTGDPCTGGDECANVCDEGNDSCLRSAGTACTDDGNVCTDDECDGIGGCGHSDNTLPCSDGTVCTTNDQCSGGTCVSGSTLDCDDGIQCTLDSCDSIDGCVHDAAAMDGFTCDDGDGCSGGDICNSAACAGVPLPIDCDDANICTLDTCNPLGGCEHDASARDGFSCDDANSCTQNDSCTAGVCVGVFVEADTDGDGYCDRIENGVGCNPNDAAEIPPQSAAFAGRPGLGPGEVMMTFNVPAGDHILVTTDPSCQTAGVCGPIGFCVVGAIGDPCAADADCALPVDTCRIVVNYGDVLDLSLLGAKFIREPHPGFAPTSPGCSRKVDLTLDLTRSTNRLKLKTQGTVLGRTKRDSDRFKYLTP